MLQLKWIRIGSMVLLVAPVLWVLLNLFFGIALAEGSVDLGRVVVTDGALLRVEGDSIRIVNGAELGGSQLFHESSAVRNIERGLLGAMWLWLLALLVISSSKKVDDPTA